MKQFKDVVALVTGGGGGIGRELCLALEKEGARVISADIAFDRSKETAALCRNALAYEVDVTSRTSLSVLRDQIERDAGSVGLLCANAGVVPPRGPVTQVSDDDWEFATSVNLYGVIRTVDTFYPHLVASKPNAHVLITSSMGGIMVRGHMPLGSYTPSKYACVGYAEELRHQFDGEGIGVSLLLPGLIDTPMAKHSAEARPIELGSQDAPIREGLSPRLMEMAIRADSVATVAIEGIRNEYFYINTHKDAVQRIRVHFENILREIENQGVEPGITYEKG